MTDKTDKQEIDYMATTILLVDPDASFVDKLHHKYLAMGCRVFCAPGKAEADIILASTRPDIVVTEVMLERPDSGFALAWEVKKKYPGVPVIIVTDVSWKTGLHFDLSSPESRDWIKADAFLDKPILAEQLDSVLQSLLKAAKAA